LQVIFSQSLHDVSYEPANSNSSSTEKIPPSHTGDVESSSSLVADPSVTDSFPRVFREFDFLEAEHDTVSESTDSCFNWLSTMRPPSDSLEVSSEKTPLQEEARSETISEEDSCCEEELEDDEFAVDDEQQRAADVSSLAESIRCSHSEALGECSRSQQLPLFLQCNHHTSAQGEHQWLASFGDLSADQTGHLTAHATLLFTQLYRVNLITELLKIIELLIELL
uniref:Rav1p_C domain-containing protein n=1 Tax=Gongylonema pulchrum TaxID=637853 RepID=A0A183D241_9BILA